MFDQKQITFRFDDPPVCINVPSDSSALEYYTRSCPLCEFNLASTFYASVAIPAIHVCHDGTLAFWSCK